MNNRIAISLSVMIAMGLPARAQNNPIFFGGPGDGFTTNAYMQATPDALIFRGGTGDGFSTDSYEQSSVTLFSGGVGGGYILASSGIPAVDKIFFGGIADGSATASSGSPQLDMIFFGGSADGIAFAGSSVPNVDKIFYGGPGDGWSGGYFFNIPLPLNLLDFSGLRKDGTHILNWETAPQPQTQYFILERATDKQAFEALGKIPATEDARYSFTDSKPARGNNFYRLKLTDNAGHISYSSTVLLKWLGNNTLLNIYPNPTASLLNIVLSGDAGNKEILIDIYDAAGRLVRHNSLKTSTPVFTIDVAKLAAGIYTIRIIDQDDISTLKFIKQ